MADTDWGSLTAALIPATVGAAFGGRGNRTSSAALGLAEGVGAIEKNRMDAEQFNANYKIKQDELDLHNRALEETKARNIWLNRQVEDEMKTAEQQRLEKADLHANMMRDDRLVREHFKDDPAGYIAYRANPAAWQANDMDQFKDQKKLETAATIASSIPGFVPKGANAQDVLKSVGKKVFYEVVQNDQKQRGEMQQIAGRTAGALQEIAARHAGNMAEIAAHEGANRYDMVPLADYSGFLKKDKKTGAMTIVTMEELGSTRPMRDADRMKADAEMRKIWATEMTNNPAKIPYSDWKLRPSNQAIGDLMGRKLTPDQYDSAVAGIQQRKITNYSSAMGNAKAAWASVNGRNIDQWQPQDEQDFQKRLSTPDGNAALQRWIDYEEADPGKFIKAKKIADSGLIEQGNITNLYDRPVLKNADGSVSTTKSFSFAENGREVLIPQVIGGKELSKKDAIAHYHKTGEHLGKFATPAAATAYAEALHNEQGQRLEVDAAKKRLGIPTGKK